MTLVDTKKRSTQYHDISTDRCHNNSAHDKGTGTAAGSIPFTVLQNQRQDATLRPKEDSGMAAKHRKCYACLQTGEAAWQEKETIRSSCGHRRQVYV